MSFKIFFIIYLLTIFGLFFNVNVPKANAQTDEELRAQIERLLVQIAEVQRQIAKIQKAEKPSSVVNLKYIANRAASVSEIVLKIKERVREMFILEDYVGRKVEVEGIIKEAESKFGAKLYVLCDLKNFSSYRYVYNSSTQKFEKAFKENCVNLAKPAFSSKDVDEIKAIVESKLSNPVNKTVKVSGNVFVYNTPCDQQTQVSCMRFIGINPENIALILEDSKNIN